MGLVPPGGFLCPVRHRITREGHLDQQVAGVQAPPLGLHTSLLLILPVGEDHRERERDEECEVKKKKGRIVKEKVLTDSWRG